MCQSSGMASARLEDFNLEALQATRFTIKL